MLLLAQLYAERAAKTIAVCEARDLAAVLTVFTTADEDPHRSPQASAPERRLPRAQATIIALSAAAMLHGSSTTSTFAAEQERLARGEREWQRQARQAAKAARKQAEEKQAEAQGQAQELEEQGHRQAPIADLARSGRTSSAAARKGSGEEGSVASLAAATRQLSHVPSTASSMPSRHGLPTFSVVDLVAAWSASRASGAT